MDLREELSFAFIDKDARGGVPLARVYAAMVALCCPEVAFSCKIDLRGARADLADFGGGVYVTLRERGWKVADLSEAGKQLFVLLGENLFPREPEVKAALGNSEGGAGTH
jgi:hypothetical protein